MKFNCMLELVSVFGLLLDIIVEFTAIPVCLTWNTTDIHLIVKCIVPAAQFDIVIADPHGNFRGHCNFRHTPHCSQRYQYDLLFEDHYGYFTAVTLKTNLHNVEGNWICQHGKEETKSQVSFTEGMIPSIDMQISGAVTKINGTNLFKIVCFSCWVSYEKGVDMYVNGVQQDSIRYHEGLCYHKKYLCKQESCTCSSNGKNFTWSFISDLSYIKFACGMRFKDEIKSAKFIRKGNLIYNGSAFIQMDTTTMSIFDSNSVIHSDRIPDNTYTDDTDDTGLFGYVMLGIVCAIIPIMLIVCFCRIHSRRKRNSTIKKQVIGEDINSEDAPLIVIGEDINSEDAPLIVIGEDINSEDVPLIGIPYQTYTTKPVAGLAESQLQKALVYAEVHSFTQHARGKSCVQIEGCKICCICSNSLKDEQYSRNLLKNISKYGFQQENITLIYDAFPDKICSDILSTVQILIIVFPTENEFNNDNFVELVETAGRYFKASPLMDILPVVRSEKASLPPWLTKLKLFRRCGFEFRDALLCCPKAKTADGVRNSLIIHQKRLNKIIISVKTCSHITSIVLAVLKGWGMELEKERMSFHLNTLQSISEYEPICLYDIVTYFVTDTSISFLRFYVCKELDLRDFKFHTHMHTQFIEIFKRYFGKRLDDCWYHYRRNGISHRSSFEEYLRSIFLIETHSVIYQNFGEYESRFSSFAGYPIENKLFWEKLAFAGFFYFKVSDYVQCFSCKGCLRAWNIMDDPMVRHRENFKTCHFLMQANRIINPRKKTTPITNYTIHELKDRIKSFKAFPVIISDSEVKRLAVAGFFYCGIAMDIICLACNIGFADIRNVDDIFSLHEHYSPKCPNIVMFENHGGSMQTNNQEVIEKFARYLEFEIRQHDF